MLGVSRILNTGGNRDRCRCASARRAHHVKVFDGIPMSLEEFFTLDLWATPQVFFARDELTIGADSRVLGPGDAYYFASTVPHRFRNSHKEGTPGSPRM